MMDGGAMSNLSWKTIPLPMDLARLQMVAETDDDKKSLLALFFRLANESVNTMLNSGGGEDFLQWKNAAHSLKGSAANMGMTDLEDLCRQSEEAIELNHDQRSALLLHISEELERIKAYIVHENPLLLSSEG